MELASSNSCSNRGGGGEVRRIHIIYFLSRVGRIEHPHLIRLHHHNRNGVFLRDVKRWLGDLRGKDMPEAFAWSYKRRYKTGFVWQDLLDDDLITPISDNEYVLKGSQIFVPTPFDGSNAQDEKNFPISKVKQEIQEAELDVEYEDKQDDEGLPSADEKNETPTKTSTETSQKSSPTFCSEMSTLSQDSLKQEEGKIHGEEEQSIKTGTFPSSSSFYSNLLGKKKMSINKEKMGTDSPSSISNSSSCSSQSSFSRSKSYSNGTSKMLHNLFSTCRAVNTNDAALVPVVKKSASSSRKHIAEIRRGERFGGSARTFGTSWNQQHSQLQQQQQQEEQHSTRRSYDGLHQKQQQQPQQGSSRVVSKSNLPVSAPLCSQCRKPFRPEKLHNHMKYCRGMKAFSRKSAAAPPNLSENPPFEDSTFVFLLTN